MLAEMHIYIYTYQVPPQAKISCLDQNLLRSRVHVLIVQHVQVVVQPRASSNGGILTFTLTRKGVFSLRGCLRLHYPLWNKGMP